MDKRRIALFGLTAALGLGACGGSASISPNASFDAPKGFSSQRSATTSQMGMSTSTNPAQPSPGGTNGQTQISGTANSQISNSTLSSIDLQLSSLVNGYNQGSPDLSTSGGSN